MWKEYQKTGRERGGRKTILVDLTTGNLPSLMENIKRQQNKNILR